MEPADAEPRVKPQTKDVKVVRRRRRSKGMPRRGAFVGVCVGFGNGAGMSSANSEGVVVAILGVDVS